MTELLCKPIGKIQSDRGDFNIQLYPEFIDALNGLEGFSHIQIVWWFSEFDKPEFRNVLTMTSPYKNGPDELGIFATRSPIRPNPIALSSAQITYIDYQQGIIGLTYTDAFDGTPILDIKPYTPSVDRVENPKTPTWCSHWPKSYEESADFDWENEMND